MISPQKHKRKITPKKEIVPSTSNESTISATEGSSGEDLNNNNGERISVSSLESLYEEPGDPSVFARIFDGPQNKVGNYNPVDIERGVQGRSGREINSVGGQPQAERRPAKCRLLCILLSFFVVLLMVLAIALLTWWLTVKHFNGQFGGGHKHHSRIDSHHAHIEGNVGEEESVPEIDDGSNGRSSVLQTALIPSEIEIKFLEETTTERVGLGSRNRNNTGRKYYGQVERLIETDWDWGSKFHACGDRKYDAYWDSKFHSF